MVFDGRDPFGFFWKCVGYLRCAASSGRLAGRYLSGEAEMLEQEDETAM